MSVSKKNTIYKCTLNRCEIPKMSLGTEWSVEYCYKTINHLSKNVMKSRNT